MAGCIENGGTVASQGGHEVQSGENGKKAKEELEELRGQLEACRKRQSELETEVGYARRAAIEFELDNWALRAGVIPGRVEEETSSSGRVDEGEGVVET